MPASHAALPVVALVGRPNVGKSTLFNRLLGLKRAVVHATPGVTRDRNYAQASYKRHEFLVVDTGGFEPESRDEMLIQMREQSLLAIEEADAIVFIADVRDPDNPADDEIVQRLRRSGKPVFLAVNKCDSPRLENEGFALARFGFERLYPLSALHGTGVLDLLDDLVEVLPERVAVKDAKAIHVAIVGRQNVGKSTLLNRLIGEERVIANATPGTTRDAIDTYLEREGKRYCLIDTAGIRRRGKIERGIENLSVLSSSLAIQRCDVALLVLDAERGIHQQDTHIAGAVLVEMKPCILVLNKWDAVEKDNETYGQFIKNLKEDFNFIAYARIVTISALTGQRCDRLWEQIDFCVAQSQRKVPTADLNRVVQAAVDRVSPPAVQGRVMKIKYATQVGIRPPSFALFVNDPKLVHFSYERYLHNRLREAFDLEGTPIRVFFRRKAPPKGWEAEVEETPPGRTRPAGRRGSSSAAPGRGGRTKNAKKGAKASD